VQLTIHTTESAPSASKPILEGIAADLGFVPNMAAAIATSPALLSAFDGLRRAVSKAELDPVSREVAGVAVGVVVDNHYGVAFHSTILGRLGVAETQIDRMRSGESPDDDRLASVYELARQVVIERGKVDEDVIARAHEAGLSGQEILDLVAECTLAGLVGVVDNLADRIELDEAFLPRAWKR
jgi:alkylhydroperoxidase family enzyme